MKLSVHTSGQEQDIVDLFKNTFAASEGTNEGELIGELVRRQLEETPSGDIFVFIAREDEELLGAGIFTRLTFEQDRRVAFVLAPMAVTTTRQGQGVGQKLLTYGLKTLQEHGVEVAMTYGDPNYYGKVGFQPISEKDAAAPFKLQMPEGWLAQSFIEPRVTPLNGRAKCVLALNDPIYW